MAKITVVSVQRVTADSLAHVRWLRPEEPDDTVVVAHIGDYPSEYVSLFFDNRGDAARFFDAGAEMVTAMADKNGDDQPVVRRSGVEEFVSEWRHHGAFTVSPADVNMLISEIERLRAAVSPMHCTGFVPGGDPADSCARCGEREDLHADVQAEAAALDADMADAAERIAQGFDQDGGDR